MSKKSRCPHSNLRGIYGDEVIFATPHYSRLQCIDCGKFLDGSVELAELRKVEQVSKPTLPLTTYCPNNHPFWMGKGLEHYYTAKYLICSECGKYFENPLFVKGKNK